MLRVVNEPVISIPERNQEDSGRDLDGGKQAPEALKGPQEDIEREGGQEKRHCQPHRVDEEQPDTRPHMIASGGERQHRPQNRPDARGPTRSKRDPYPHRSQIADGFVVQMHAALAFQRGQAQNAGQVQAQQDDDGASDASDPDSVVSEELAQEGRRRAEQYEDQRKAGYEQEGVGHRGTPVQAGSQILKAHPGDEGKVARHEGEDAW